MGLQSCNTPGYLSNRNAKTPVQLFGLYKLGRPMDRVLIQRLVPGGLNIDERLRFLASPHLHKLTFIISRLIVEVPLPPERHHDLLTRVLFNYNAEALPPRILSRSQDKNRVIVQPTE